MDSTFGKALGIVCGSRSLKTIRRLFKQLKSLLTMIYGIDYLKTYEHLIPTSLHFQGNTFKTQIEPLNCGLGITWPDCTAKRCATVNPNEYWKFL